jgi:hypothetical protein
MKASAASAAPKQPELQCAFVKCPPGQVCETGMCKVGAKPAVLESRKGYRYK